MNKQNISTYMHTTKPIENFITIIITMNLHNISTQQNCWVWDYLQDYYYYCDGDMFHLILILELERHLLTVLIPKFFCQIDMVKNKGFLPSGPSEIPIQRNQMKDIIYSLLSACRDPDIDTGVAFKADAIIANPPAYG